MVVIFGDMLNIAEKGGVNVIPGGPESSRYASRNFLAAILGPSVGLIETGRSVTAALSAGEFSQSELHAMRKMMWLQNHFAFRNMFDAMEEGISRNAGLSRRRK